MKIPHDSTKIMKNAMFKDRAKNFGGTTPYPERPFIKTLRYNESMEIP